MKILIAGCGNIGAVAAEDLAKNMPSAKFVVADNDEKRAWAISEKIGTNNVSGAKLDVTNRKQSMKTLKEFDMVTGFLPGKLGYNFAKTCIDAGKSLVDVSYMAENPLDLDREAAKANVTIIPDCGLAPGISNVLVGHAIRKLDKVKAIHIMVGGLPEKPLPPLGYVITWSPESLIDEYTRKARIVRNGKELEVDALTGLEEIEFPNVGKLEAFYTDGLRTLARTIKAEDMWEKTLRFPGHAEKIKALESLGFFGEEKVNIEGFAVSPRKMTARLFEQKLRKQDARDIVALKIEVIGTKKRGEPMKIVYHLLDRYDRKNAVTAMARTTAYPASIMTQLMVKGAIKEKGVVPPERVGMSPELFQAFLTELEKRGIKISEKEIK